MPDFHNEEDSTVWYVLAQLWSAIVGLLHIARLSTDDKDLEIMILRHQLDVLQRKHNQVVRPSREQPLTLAVLAAALKKRSRITTRQLARVIRILQPETVIG